MQPQIKSPSQSGNLRPILQGALIVLLILLAYFPALRGQFLWDDDANVTDNLTLRSMNGLRQIWLEPGATQQYYPLTHTSFWLEYHLWGLNPLGYHVVNILLHAFSALLLWRILLRLGVKPAWFGAALFALHPTCVESVAWITERKNTLSGVFFLGSIFAGLRFWLPGCAMTNAARKSRRQAGSIAEAGLWKFYWLALIFYVCALWAKTATVGLPVVLALLIWWKRGKVGWRNAFLLLPFLAAGMAMGLMTMWVEKHSVGASGREWSFSWVERCLIAGRAFWFYLEKLFWPHPLIFVYPRWEIHASQFLAYLPGVAAGACLLVLWRGRNGRARPALFATGCFIVLLFPVLGFFNVFFYRYSFVSDHFQYLAAIGPLMLAGAGLSVAAQSLARQSRIIAPAICGVLLLVLGIMTWRQTGVYRDPETLWRETLRCNPGSWLAENNLGLELIRTGNLDEAIQHFVASVKDKPDYAPFHDNLGNALARKGKVDEAFQQYATAIQLDPNYAPAHNDLANALNGKGNADAAIQQFIQALQIDPNYAGAHYNLGNALIGKGNADEAIQHFNRALEIDPNLAGAHYSLANALIRKGNVDEAILHFIQALRIEPQGAGVHNDLGLALAGKGRVDEAIQHFTKAAQIEPNFALAHYNLGTALALRGDVEAAAGQFRDVLRINPNLPEARYNLGMSLAQQGKLAEARDQFAEALRLKPGLAEAEQQLRALSAAENTVQPPK